MQIIDGIHYYPRESDAREGFLVVPPVGYTTDKKYPVHFIVHGVGERGAGLLENLMNLSMGFDYDGAGPLPRQYALLTTELKANANKHQHIVVMVNYPVNFDPSDVDFVLNTVEADFSVDKTRINGVGFSWGGREMIRYITSSLSRAQRFAVVILAAPVNPGGNLQYIVDANLQVIGITCIEDKRVDPSNIKSLIAALNAKNPAIKPYFIQLPGEGHSGLMEFLNGNNPYIPQTMFSYLDATSTVDRKQYPTSITKPVDPIPSQPTTVTPVTSYMISGNKIALIGKNSKGYTDGYQGVWALKSAPGGVTAKQVFPTGSSYIDANGILPVPGTYVFTFTLKGANPVDVTVQYGTVTPVEKIPAGYDLTRKVLSFTDGSVAEGVKADFTTTDGKVYSV